MKIVLLTHPCDLGTLAALHAASFSDAWSAAWIGKLMEQLGVFACLAGDESGGFVLVRAAGGEAEVLTLAVTPAARRRGIGTELIAAAARQAHEMGAETMFLEVGEANLPAKLLYARLGFREVARRRGYYASSDGGNEDALVLSVELPLSRVGNLAQLD